MTHPLGQLLEKHLPSDYPITCVGGICDGYQILASAVNHAEVFLLHSSLPRATAPTPWEDQSAERMQEYSVRRLKIEKNTFCFASPSHISNEEALNHLLTHYATLAKRLREIEE